MKRNWILILMILPLILTAQEEAPERGLWQTIYLTPNPANLKALGAAMTHHNQTYHKDAPYKASVYSVANGPNTGKMIWMMGPLKYADLDNRPNEAAHDADWRDNVVPNLSKAEQGEFWKTDFKLSNFKPNNGPAKLVYVRYHEINDGQGHRLNDHLTKISETIKSMPDGGMDWGVFYNEFWQGSKIGRHVATCGFLKSWAELDQDLNFKKAFEAKYGENAWTGFVQDAQDIFSDQWDEIWEYIGPMSSDQ